MKKQNGWDRQCADPWDEIYALGLEADFEYKGKEYSFELCENPPRIVDYTDVKNPKIIATYKNEKDFYNSTLFGKPILDVFDEAKVKMVW